MPFINKLDETQWLLVKFWLPALVNGGIVWALLLIVGETPLVRASGLALVIVGVTLALRRMGSVLAMVGGLTLALSPVFWSQTGGGQGEPATIVIALAVAVVATLVVVVLSKRPAVGLGLGVVIFVGLFWSQIGTPRSIRLTAFVVSWVMFLLIDMLLVTNPRPDEAPLILRDGGLKSVDGAVTARAYHTFGLLLLVTVGILNDPLLTLLIPAIALSLILTRTQLPWWYWLAIGVVLGIGLRGLWIDYLMAQGHLIDLWQWRIGQEWLTMIELLVAQFTVLGAALSLLGVARLARWYAPLGIVSMTGFAAYWLFGLVYSGPDETLLLLPMLIIFVLWMSYAVLAISEWAAKTVPEQPRVGRYVVIGVYALLPLMMLWQIVTV